MIVTNQLAALVAEELASMFACAAIGELVDDGAHVGELRRRVCPYIRTLRLSFAGNEHLHRRLVGVQHIVLEKHFAKRVDQRL